MNASLYLSSFGWKEGEALQNGGIKKPILVKHKKDNKGLGADGNDADMWWETLFDGQLKSLEVSSTSAGVSFEQNQSKVEDHTRKANSPLYRMFVRGEGLAGTVGKTDNAHVVSEKVSAKDVLDTVEREMGVQSKTEEKEKDRRKVKKEKKKKVKEEKKAKKQKTQKKKAKDVKIIDESLKKIKEKKNEDKIVSKDKKSEKKQKSETYDDKGSKKRSLKKSKSSAKSEKADKKRKRDKDGLEEPSKKRK